MINLTTEKNIVNVAVLGEFTITDFHQIEAALQAGMASQNTINLLMDLRDMLAFTIDVAWEELHFSRTHANAFGKIAIVTDNQWIAWSTWLNRMFTKTEIDIFDTLAPAEAWLGEI